MGKDKKHFLFNLEWVEILKELPSEVRYEVYDAIMEYVASGILSDLKPIAKGVFLFIKKEIDYNESQYQKTVNARKEAGSKGGKARQAKRLLATQANAAFAKQNKQNLANSSINDIDIVSDNDILELDESNSLSGDMTPDCRDAERKEESSFSSSKSIINYANLRDFFNARMDKENAVISRIRSITDKRKKAVNARCREYGKDAIFTVILNASKSDFLNGKNNRNWVADFDWIFLPNNFPKILEGNYNNNQHKDERTNIQRFNGAGNVGNNGIPFKGKVDLEYGLYED